MTSKTSPFFVPFPRSHCVLSLSYSLSLNLISILSLSISLWLVLFYLIRFIPSSSFEYFFFEWLFQFFYALSLWSLSVPFKVSFWNIQLFSSFSILSLKPRFLKINVIEFFVRKYFILSNNQNVIKFRMSKMGFCFQRKYFYIFGF